jgi:sulfur-carrier protein
MLLGKIWFTFLASNQGKMTQGQIEASGSRMAVIVRIPTFFQPLTGGREDVTAGPGTVIGIIDQLEVLYPGIRERVVEAGRIRGHLNIFLNEDDIRYLEAEETQVRDGDELTIIPAIAGGS